MYTLDTNALIYYLKDEPRAAPHVHEALLKNVPVFISAITEIELFAFPDLTANEIEKIQNLLRILVVIPVDSRIARTAGKIRRLYRLKLPDSAIAATALFTGSKLMTRNVKDFRRVPQLNLVAI